MESIVRAFAKVGINAAADEDTPDSQFKKQVVKYEALSAKRKRSLAASLLDDHQQDVKLFSESMEKVLSRQIKSVYILPLHGSLLEFATVDEALDSIQQLDLRQGATEFVRYEIEVRYDNGNSLRGNFQDKDSAIDFLVSYRTPATPAKART